MLFLKVKKRIFLEMCAVFKKYYKNPLYRKADLLLRASYLFENPFRMHRKFLQGEHAYGETPLTTMESICKECQISKQDIVYELGAGRGLTCFWLSIFIGCEVVGIEYFEKFTQRAIKVAKKLEIKNLSFLCEKIEEVNLKAATVIYFYGSNAQKPLIDSLVKKIEKLPNGVKIITVSFSLSSYTSLIRDLKSFNAPFTWGITKVYLQEVSY